MTDEEDVTIGKALWHSFLAGMLEHRIFVVAITGLLLLITALSLKVGSILLFMGLLGILITFGALVYAGITEE